MVDRHKSSVRQVTYDTQGAVPCRVRVGNLLGVRMIHNSVNIPTRTLTHGDKSMT